MKLDENQRQQIAQWIELGLKLSEIQSRIASDFKVSLTYMDVRFLVDDLKLTPKDPAPLSTPPTPPPPAPASQPTLTGQAAVANTMEPPPQAPKVPGGVSVTVDQIARPGALVSGKVTFSDGQQADWSLDQMGRLGLAAQQKGYRPSQADIQEFQQALQNELAKMGF